MRMWAEIYCNVTILYETIVYVRLEILRIGKCTCFENFYLLCLKTKIDKGEKGTACESDDESSLRIGLRGMLCFGSDG